MTGIEIALLATAILGTVVSGVGAFSAAQSAAASAEFDADVAERNAALARNQASADADDSRRDARRRIGAIRAQMGSSGFSLTGSPLLVLEDQAAESELDAQRIEFGGEVRAIGQEDSAAASRAEASSFRSSALIGAIGSGIGGLNAAAGSSAGKSVLGIS